MANVLEVKYDKDDVLVMKMFDCLLSSVRAAYEYPTHCLSEYIKRVQEASTGDLAKGLLTKEDKEVISGQLFDPRSEYIPLELLHQLVLMGYQESFTRHFLDLFTRVAYYPLLLVGKEGWYHYPLNSAKIDMVDGKPFIVSLFTDERHVVPDDVSLPLTLGNTFVSYNPTDKEAVVVYEVINLDNETA